MFLEEENEIVLENTENTEEQTVEEIVESETDTAEEEKTVKMFTEEEVKQKLDEVIPKKLARKEAKIRKEHEEEMAPYRELEEVIHAGLGTKNIEEATARMREFYNSRGVDIPQTQKPSYSDDDLRVLADNEAKEIIALGLDEVREELDRLVKKDVANMTSREKLVFQKLAEFEKLEENKKELLSIGVKEDVIGSEEFKTFAGQFNPNTPIKKIYELYEKTLEKTHVEKIGSMKNGSMPEEKMYYTPDEVDKLTPEQLENPRIQKIVRTSMYSW